MPADNTQTVEQLEQRAATMEKNLTELTKQVGSGGNGAALEARLRELLTLMLQDREECETVRAQRDALTEENARLKLLVSKGEYRAMHLLRTIGEIEGAQKQKQ